MKKLQWYPTALILAVLILASFTIACVPSTPSSSPSVDTPSYTQSPQEIKSTEEESAEEPASTAPSPEPLPVSKRALFVIYAQFEETEYSEPLIILQDAGVTVTVASRSLGAVTGHLGTQVKPDIKLSEVHGADYDAIVLVGGYGYVMDDPEAYRIVQEAAAEGKVLAAICVAPITLAKTGLLKGKRATSSINSWIQSEGAIPVYTSNVVRDGLIITANGPDAAKNFGETIVTALQE
jgi:protease I